MKRHHDSAHAGYGAISIILHWVTAFLVIAIFGLALAPGLIKGSVALHGSLGIVLLGIVLLRAAWRILEGRVAADREAPPKTRTAASIVHAAFYVLLFAVPLLGLVYVDAKAVQLTFFGVTLPQMVYYDRDLAQAVYAAKTWLAYTLLALIFVHAAAAIVYHHLIRRDRVLRGILAWRTRRAGNHSGGLAGSTR
jgi:cytochrome b561